MSADHVAQYPKYLKNIQYSKQTYIHGGAWRDPAISSDSFNPALSFLLDHPIVDNIAGLASINYRLSPYTSHAISPSSPDDAARNAKHPDHIQDVLTALAFLQSEYGFGDNYLLVGHSCGATLAFQVTMGKWQAQSAARVSMPQGILGLEGIYDLVALRDTHQDIPVYQEIIKNAFGDEKHWNEASPTFISIRETWTNVRLAGLAHSANDELVEFEQLQLMAATLKERDGSGREDLVLSLEGKHDDVWRNGWELAQSIITAVQHLLASRCTRDIQP
ncbi:MAG: hypothetical protein M1830_004233 [Pleopsidium flavum]|nr:MAG: hypothetical protein M1830_004233 [Pleopsidium flavum]